MNFFKSTPSIASQKIVHDWAALPLQISSISELLLESLLKRNGLPLVRLAEWKTDRETVRRTPSLGWLPTIWSKGSPGRGDYRTDPSAYSDVSPVMSSSSHSASLRTGTFTSSSICCRGCPASSLPRTWLSLCSITGYSRSYSSLMRSEPYN